MELHFFKMLQHNPARKLKKTRILLAKYGRGCPMYQLCRHIKTNGQRCQYPALRGSAYCYFHSRVHTMAKAKSSNWDDIKLPLIEDSASIQVAISQIMAGFLSSRLDARHTGLLLYALQIASQNIDRASSREDSEIVHSMTVTGVGDELAPEKAIGVIHATTTILKKRSRVRRRRWLNLTG
jgi:hypothetical protein